MGDKQAADIQMYLGKTLIGASIGSYIKNDVCLDDAEEKEPIIKFKQSI